MCHVTKSCDHLDENDWEEELDKMAPHKNAPLKVRVGEIQSKPGSHGSVVQAGQSNTSKVVTLLKTRAGSFKVNSPHT